MTLPTQPSSTIRRCSWRPLSIAASCIAAFTLAAHASDQIPATQPAHPILLTNATIHPVSGRVIQNGSILIVNGKIAGVGKVDAPADAVTIDCANQHVYPGLIDASTDMGLNEIDAVRATRDTAEAGQINPNARAQVAVNPDSELIPVTRSNGILIAHVMPEGGLLSGTSAVMMLDGWTWEDMTLVPSASVVMNFPSMVPWRSFENPEDERRQAENRARQMKQIDQVFDDARAYALASAPTKSTAADGLSTATTSPTTLPAANFDTRWEAMKPVLDGTLPLFIRADEMGQITAAVAFAKRQNVRCVIVGGRDADRCADLLKSMDVPVILTGTQRLPGNPDDGYDSVYALPAKLKEAGVRFAVAGSGSTYQVRNLPYQAASAIAFGLSPEDALKSITLSPAQILGVAAHVGTIEVGKDATLILTDGDVLEVTSNVHRAFIQGREIDLGDRHKSLRDKYEKRIAASTQPAK